VTEDPPVPLLDTMPGLQRDVPLPEPEGDDAPALELVRGDGRPGDAGEEPLVRSLADLLLDPDILKPPEAVAPRLAYRGRTSLIAGREKTSGKSTLLTAAAAAVTRGADFLDGRCLEGPVLWVTADQEHAGDIVRRAVRFGAAPARFSVLWPRKPFADLVATLALSAESPDPFPVLVVIDTLANFARVEDPFSSAEWPNVLMPLVRVARDLNAAVVLTHHAGKGDNGGYRDSTAIGAIVDCILELAPDTTNPARRHVKALGRWPMSNFTVELGGDQYTQVAGGDLSLDAQVLAFVQQHPGCSKRALRDGVGGGKDDVERALAQLLERGAIANRGGDHTHAYYVAEAHAPEPSAEREPGAGDGLL
jgi:AAA domain-containing protein